MDEIRDTQGNKNLSRFFDDADKHVNPFGSNQSADRAYRRAERIVAGIFLATGHLAATESLRISVRTTSLEMLENVLSLRGEMRIAESVNASNFRASIRYLISLLRMLAVSGFLSMQNSSALIEALDDLASFLVAVRSSPLSDTVSFSRQDFLDIGGPSLRDIKDTRNVKDKSIVRDTKEMSDTHGHSATMNVRKGNILEILRARGELGIAEISSNLPEYGKKMIQRDLTDLITLGKVKKTGLKRWSRYSVSG